MTLEQRRETAEMVDTDGRYSSCMGKRRPRNVSIFYVEARNKLQAMSSKPFILPSRLVFLCSPKSSRLSLVAYRESKYIYICICVGVPSARSPILIDYLLIAKTSPPPGKFAWHVTLGLTRLGVHLRWITGWLKFGNTKRKSAIC